MLEGSLPTTVVSDACVKMVTKLPPNDMGNGFSMQEIVLDGEFYYSTRFIDKITRPLQDEPVRR